VDENEYYDTNATIVVPFEFLRHVKARLCK
jgi:hypothetical protein